MIELSSALEKRLKTLIKRADERKKFVNEVVEKAIDHLESRADKGLPETIGGTLHLFTDGGSRGNPGEAAIGCVLVDTDTGKYLKLHKERIGIQTNNVAEYMALIRGLEIATQHHPKRLICHLDSELIVKQLSGEYKVKMPTLQPLYDQIQELAASFRDIHFCHIPRSQNTKADKLVNEALDGR